MDANRPNSKICRYFLRGFCRFGLDCWYQHQIPVCRFFQRGRCREGQGCRYRHVLVPKPETRDASAQTEDSEDEQRPSVPSAAAAGGRHTPSDVTCSICMENIWEKNLPKHKTFGMLPNCSHVFCEPCIATWRQMDGYSPDVVKGCPVGRIRSDFYLRSGSVVEGEAKEGLALSTKQRCREDFCSFQAACGLCPFQDDCRYLTARRLEHQEEEEEEDDNEDDVQFFTWVVRWGEENLRHFLDEARNDPDTLRQFMMRFV